MYQLVYLVDLMYKRADLQTGPCQLTADNHLKHIGAGFWPQ